MRAWSLLLVCGLRLHRWSDRAVAGAAVAGMRPARRRCSTASPGPCPRSSRWSGIWSLQPGRGLWLTRELADQMNVTAGPGGSQVAAAFTLRPR